MSELPPVKKKTTEKLKLDQALLSRGLASSLAEARALIMSGKVRVEGQKADKAGTLLKPGQEIRLLEPEIPFVSRGGLKLDRAMEHFAIKVDGLACLDLGSSTGGFTDCLLQRGAAKVFAFDVGQGQMDWGLRQDPRVTVREGVNARDLTPADLPEPADFACMDVSFISARTLLPVLASLLKAGGRWVVLVKPQFEAEKREVGAGGIVRDAAVRERTCAEVFEAAKKSGLGPLEIIPAPHLSEKKNQEFLLYGKKSE